MSQGRSWPVTETGGADQPAAGLAHGGVGLGQEVVEPGLQLALVLGVQLVEATLQLVALDRVGAAVLGGPDLLQLGFDRAGPLGQPLAELRGLGLQLALAERLEPLFFGVDPVHHRLEALPLAVEASAEDRCHHGFDHAGSKYNRCRVDVLRDRIGHPVAQGQALPGPPAHLGSGDLDGGDLDGPGDEGRGRDRDAVAGKHHDRGQPGDLRGLAPGLELGGGVGPQEQGDLESRAPGPGGRGGCPRYTRGPRDPARPAPPRAPGPRRTARSSMAARCSADAPWRPRLNGCSRAGTKRSESSPRVSAATWPTIRCP